MLKLTRAQFDKIKANNFLAAGGEAQIFTYKNDLVMKVYYLPSQATSTKDAKRFAAILKQKEEKLKLVIGFNLPPNIVKPIDLVYVENEFVGYTMKRLKYDETIRNLAKNKRLKKYGYSNKDILEIIIQILDTVSIIHQQGLVIGDVNDNNIVVMNKKVYFLDFDSYGFNDKFRACNYTEEFTAPEAYKANNTIDLTQNTDYFSIAIICFNLITGINPFSGTYKKEPNLYIKDRILKKISVLGNHNIQTIKQTRCWNWLSPVLLKKFLEIFEQQKREPLNILFEELYANLKYCDTHKMYYYSKYSTCPLCDNSAKVITVPQKIAINSNSFITKVIFSSSDVNIFLNRYFYLSNNRKIVSRITSKSVDAVANMDTYFLSNGMFIIHVGKELIKVVCLKDNSVLEFERKYNTCYTVIDDSVYYVDKNNMLIQNMFSTDGNVKRPIINVFNSIFEFTQDSRFIASFYPGRAEILVDNMNFSLLITECIKEYGLKFDPKSRTWCFIYKKKNGKYQTMIFSNKKVEYNSDNITYKTLSLANICYSSYTIYEPQAQKIVGYNLLNNRSGEFACNVVTEDSSLIFESGHFEIVNEDKIYYFGS